MDLEEYYKKNYRGLVNRLAGMIGNRNEAEDRVQNIFLRILERAYVSRHVLNDPEPDKYFNRAVTLQAIEYYKLPKNVLFDPQDTPEDSQLNLVDYREVPPEFNMLQKEKLQCIVVAMSKMSATNVMIVIARTYWDFTGPEIAQGLGITSRSCYVKYNECIRKLRKVLKDEN